MARPRVAPLAITLMALVSATACSTAGHSFNHARVQTLEFGAMSSGTYQSVFGKPINVVAVTNSDGRFERATFGEANREGRKQERRVLQLEFRDGILNGWTYVSNFEEDRTLANVLLAARMQKTVHEKKDVREVLGPPPGKVLCPSLLVEKECTGAAEVWMWASLEMSTAWESAIDSTSAVVIVFDTSGVVKEVMTEVAKRTQ